MSSPHDGKSFEQRLKILLDGRKPTPWGVSLRIESGTMSRMMGGHVPTREILQRIQRAENCALSWLITGTGPPFIVTGGPDREVIVAIRAALGEPPAWHAVLATAEDQAALLLHRSVSFHETGPQITECRVYGGINSEAPGSEFSLLGRDNLAGEPAVIELDKAQWLRLATGWMGTWELFRGGANIHAELKRADAPDASMLRESRPPAYHTGELSDAGERELLNRYRALGRKTQATALRVLHALKAPKSNPMKEKEEK